MNKDERQKELLAKKKLTDEELKELIRLSPSGSWKKPPYKMQHLGIKDIKTGFNNLRQLSRRSKIANKNKCYLEILSLRLLFLDLFLRMYICGEIARKYKILGKMRPDIMFGQLIKIAEKIGMNEKHIKRLRKFNNDRTKGVHRLLLGEIKYRDLKKVCDKYKNLGKEIRDYVLSQPFYIPMGNVSDAS